MIAAILLAAAPIVWVKVSEPMDSAHWSQVGHISFVDNECKSEHTLPRVCLYRHVGKCRRHDSVAFWPARSIAGHPRKQLKTPCPRARG